MAKLKGKKYPVHPRSQKDYFNGINLQWCARRISCASQIPVKDNDFFSILKKILDKKRK